MRYFTMRSVTQNDFALFTGGQPCPCDSVPVVVTTLFFRQPHIFLTS